jgi:hypothetical protein
MTRAVSSVITIDLMISALLAAQSLPPVNDGEPHGDPPYLLEQGWTPLLNGRDLSGWHSLDPQIHEWFTTRSVYWDPIGAPTRLLAIAEPGDRIVNGFRGRTSHLVSDQKFGDVEIYAEFLVPKDGNSGIYVHGLYEVQIVDSYGLDPPLRWEDCGAIPSRGMKDKGFAGSPPRRNASRRPGEWQSFQIWFQAPRFDTSGAKVGNAKFLRILHNGLMVQEGEEVDGPTLAHLDIPEAPTNPIMLQADHGSVAYRNFYVRPLRPLVER